MGDPDIRQLLDMTVQHLGLRICCLGDFPPGAHGCLMHNGDFGVIFLDASDSPGKQAETIAHELGHWFRHPGPGREGTVTRHGSVLSVRDSREEVQADEFGRSLLSLCQQALAVEGSQQERIDRLIGRGRELAAAPRQLA